MNCRCSSIFLNELVISTTIGKYSSALFDINPIVLLNRNSPLSGICGFIECA